MVNQLLANFTTKPQINSNTLISEDSFMNKIFFLCIFFVLSLSVSKAQIFFASDRLNSIYSSLPDECKKNLQIGINEPKYECKCSFSGKELKVIKYIEDSIITHLGLKLIKNDNRPDYPAHLVELVERTILESLIFSIGSQWLNIDEENGIILLINGVKYGQNSTPQLLSIIAKLTDSSEISFNKSHQRSAVKIENDKNSVEIQFPSRFSSISGMDKKEYGDYLFSKLCKNEKKDSILSEYEFESLELLPYGQNIWKNSGMTYSDLYFSDTYYQLKDSTSLVAVFTKEFEQESFTNTFLLSGNHNRNFELQLEFQLYNQKKSCTIKLLDFLAYFERDFNTYFGILKIDDKVMEGVLLLQNKYYNYINLLNVKADKSTFFDVSEKLDCKFFFNIPTDNIKNLFADE
jgi:hypothetical protein